MTPSLMRLVVICAIGIGLNRSSHHTISYGVAGRSPVLAVLSLRDFGATFRTGAMVFLIRWRGGRRAARRRHRSAPAAGTNSAFPELGPGAHALELARTTQTDPLKPPLSLFSLNSADPLELPLGAVGGAGDGAGTGRAAAVVAKPAALKDQRKRGGVGLIGSVVGRVVCSEMPAAGLASAGSA